MLVAAAVVNAVDVLVANMQRHSWLNKGKESYNFFDRHYKFRHYKFRTEFRQTAANFRQRRLWVLKI